MRKILCFGDSNTYGFIPGSMDGRYDADTRWTGRLQKILKSDAVIVEAGMNGRTTIFDDPICPEQSGIQTIGDTVRACGTLDLLVIMLGTNDCKRQFHLSAEQIAGHLQKVLEQAKAAASAELPVLLIAPAKLRKEASSGPFGDSFDMGSVAVSEALASTYEALTNQQDYAFLDASKIVTVSSLDGVHLDEEGHRKLAKAVADRIKEI
jgi:lysophospholipase L1-like esterase